MFKNLRMTLVLAKTSDDVIGLQSGKLPWMHEDFGSIAFDKHIKDRRVAIVSDAKTFAYNRIETEHPESLFLLHTEGEAYETVEKLSEALELSAKENHFTEVFVLGSLSLYEMLYPYFNDLFIINAKDVSKLNTKEDCVDGKDLIKRIKQDFMTFRYTDDNIVSKDIHITRGIRRVTPLEITLGEKTKKAIREALISFRNIDASIEEDEVRLKDICDNLFLNITNRVITICVDCVPVDPRFVVPMLHVDEVIEWVNPIHGFKVMDLSSFCFDTLLRGFDVCLSTNGNGNILLSELLENTGVYTDKEIRWSHNVAKMFIAGALDFKMPTPMGF